MKAQKLRKRLRKELGRITESASLIMSSDDDAEAIHRFRVEFKKMRALVRLCKARRSGDAVKIPAILKKIYRRTGKIRELQLHQTAILPWLGKGSKYLFEIQQHTRLLQQPLHNLASKALPPDAGKSLIREAPKKVSGKLLRKFLRRKAVSARMMLTQTDASDVALHSCRKALKDILYCTDFFNFPLPKRLARIGIADEKGTKGLIDLLNYHQDYADGLNILKNAANLVLPFKEKNVLYHTRVHWEQRKKLLAQRILNRGVPQSGFTATKEITVIPGPMPV